MRSFFVLALLAVVLASIAIGVRSGKFARRNPGTPINSAMRAALEGPQFSTDDALKIAALYGNSHKKPSGLQYMVRAPGDGPLPLKGQTVSVNYTGSFLNGEVFDSSAGKNGPLNFPVGRGAVIAGWDEALLEMRKGEKRTLIIPHWLAYGEKGHGKIPPSATLIFEVELVDFR